MTPPPLLRVVLAASALALAALAAPTFDEMTSVQPLNLTTVNVTGDMLVNCTDITSNLTSDETYNCTCTEVVGNLTSDETYDCICSNATGNLTNGESLNCTNVTISGDGGSGEGSGSGGVSGNSAGEEGNAEAATTEAPWPEWWPKQTWSVPGRAYAGDGRAHVMPMDAAARKAVVALHNKYRNESGWVMPPLVYDMQLEEAAQKFANMCTYMHHRPNRYGENLWLGWSLGWKNVTDEVMQAAEYWASETIYLDPEWLCINHKNPERPCGHYAQEIWPETQKIGCAFTKDCAVWNDDELWTLGYCEYWPTGNHMGSYDSVREQWLPIPPFNRTEEQQETLEKRMKYVEDKYDNLDKIINENSTVLFRDAFPEEDNHDF